MNRNPTTGDIAVVLGTRPEIIKLAPVVQELGGRARVVHTGQHWDENMSGQFLRDLTPIGGIEVLSGLGGLSRPRQIAGGIDQLSALFERRRPRAVIVQGDTNSTSIGAQTANYLGIPVIHVEAGLRSRDRDMPEELNRLIVGAVADVHCAATPYNAANLLAEGVDAERIHITGNTVVEATRRVLESSTEHVPLPVDGPFVLATIHRPENTDDSGALSRIFSALAAMPYPVVFVAHPRTLAAADRFGLEGMMERLHVLQSVGHAEFLGLAGRAALVISDSGGVQEEVTVIKKPLLVVRKSTERPEAIGAGFAELVRPGDSIEAAAERMLGDAGLTVRLRQTPSPYGDGSASRMIADIARRVADRG
ncbi:UDP-N-acetylglucosamine 2-epimerase (non-hydrolyzing) [Leifsonia sp. C5G2]|uniref:non-hydrolyzing UDP-N-acetylglucosamine 2-epimerase n=1 Tax=Leifsonia sp. C5G2 TaxID=2735269 RepID=UPI0015859FB1|nr:UDP-N-acetylglucosamine 2-epimerase (non-hydrolyzing) [Leifsonia sp. C5G2]NUU05971.1 UDP-N-acetylglucosamine 2-epimerase (non-hydrolyzing) [Leifsonia sp. C5G2]